MNSCIGHLHQRLFATNLGCLQLSRLTVSEFFLYPKEIHPQRFLNGAVELVDDLIESEGDKKQHGVSWRSFLHIMDPILSIWRMKEEEFIERYGLDSAVLLRTFLLGYDSRLINSGFVNQSVTLVVDGCDKLCLNIKPLSRRRLFFSRCIMWLVSASF
jgi:hypothetical protein